MWHKSFEDLKLHHFSSTAYAAFLIASVIASRDVYKARLQLFSFLDRSALFMGFIISGLVIILYIILYKMTKGDMLHLIFLRTEERKWDRAIKTVILIILGMFIPLTFMLSYQLAYILKYSTRFRYLSGLTLTMGSVVSGLGIILYKMTKGDILRPLILRTDERKRDRAIGTIMLGILGIYILRTVQLVRLSTLVRGRICAPLSEEFTCRILLPYAFLLAFTRIPRFAKQELWGLPLPLVVSHILSALIFASVHFPEFPVPLYDFYRFIQIFSVGIACSCVFLIFFTLTDSTTGYAGAVLLHG
ncbi:MAG: type II CAAX prenyl endopeptidase Rce1 family protein, partial [Candidatus Hodarchaeota archaeon]